METRIEFDSESSSHSTLLQAVVPGRCSRPLLQADAPGRCQEVPGLLRALSITLANHGCNIEVALIGTEGETAIDVFYVTQTGRKLDEAQQALLRESLLAAIAASRL